ncbi:TauD/TfdA family dioxygenase [Nonomuraea sp. NPDC055795]
MANLVTFSDHYLINGDDLLAQTATLLARDGLATLDGVHTRDAIAELANRMMTIYPHRDSGSDGVTVIDQRAHLAGQLGFAGFGNSAMPPHTDLSAAPLPPRLQILVCSLSGSAGGETVLVDGAGVCADLAQFRPDLLRRLEQPGTVRFADRWAAVFERIGNGRMRIRYRQDGLEHFSSAVRDLVPSLRAVIARRTRLLPLRPGQGYLIDNWRVLHGREAFTGHRRLYRVLGDPTPDLHLPSGIVIAPQPASAASSWES